MSECMIRRLQIKHELVSQNRKKTTSKALVEVEKIASVASVPSADVAEPVLFNVKSWCLVNRDERSEIKLENLANFIVKELKQGPQRVIKEAFNQGILMPSPKLGMAVVV